MLLSTVRQRARLNSTYILRAAVTLLLLVGVANVFWIKNSSGPRPQEVHKAIDTENTKHENATILSLCRNEDLNGIITSIQNLEDRFNRNHKYDWVFLNNVPFSEEFKTKVSSMVSGEAKFGLIPEEHWSYPSFIDQEKAKQERERLASMGIIYADSESYRHMCRFNSGFFYKHPLLQQYKYYWRVEPDVDFYCDIDYDPFRLMREQQKIYGFTISIYEFGATIASLWDTVRAFLSINPEAQHSNSLVDFISDDNGVSYNLCHFWSNFEIADMDFWRSKLYEDFFNYLDASGGFFYERWGDAPVHSIAVSLFLDRDKIHFFDDIGYNHGVYSMCPLDDNVWINNRCSCNKDSDFTFRGYSCGQRYYKVTNRALPPNWKEYADL
ncbi:hypothetical protein KL918_003223 [Ogataea parapolymorpha]|uniref:Glycolipid 2-alpha-mannosyltransferase 2 n=1 Tax=Ogataea parapolymorpha (strain ATCC 26012 / BCRC 20466 / JCM 22074 / NRRL Y-7560 / DL-1) TaxID=871575 RepID=W1QAH3_OGAPD|nr:Glycolipid 2-alpha-mannosyltransferase 2 [Ogataea parapolymorpha DL-1]ESW97840.1 Glycolipid 2-alpha-mannosyltransferase 2 [Ogataea parapolymorpha DL-1]KAG7867028.1 hypothetical protein KL918_003223 [Ogataea parapolymorpha]KAG7872392.1 hypothetical protein KL916_003127 [Ogataea parapolymorpha]